VITLTRPILNVDLSVAESEDTSISLQSRGYLTVLLDPNTKLPAESHPASIRSSLARIEKCLGNVFYGDGDFKKALKFYRRAVLFDSHDPILHTNQAASLFELSKTFSPGFSFLEDEEEEEDDDKEGAEDSSNDSDQDATSDDGPRHSKYRRRARKMALQDALQCCETAIAIDSSYAKAHWRKGQVLMEMGNLQAAIDSLTVANSLDSLKQVQRYATISSLRLKLL
jgi:tetratricopeptide (TPR) repeat protein